MKSPYSICWPCREATRAELTGACTQCCKAIRPEYKLCFGCREAGKAVLTAKCLACGRPVNQKYLTCFACSKNSPFNDLTL